ncbi:MAG TPA: FecR domain-containing protein, partial [Chitinophaga sp.]|nr:FecR domain-containing protein [Chitinophaga sp.]
KVELTGEAYFEIAPDASRPFSVNVDDMEVQVLGTTFNIMAYNDEDAIKTTLLQGAVKVNSKRLYPGQGASLNRQNGQVSIQDNINTDEVLAWKNGYIQFEGNDIHSVMRLIARWYDVDVVYKAPVTAHFRGTIPSNVPVSRVLKMLELTGEVHFEIKGKQIIVSP